jgi:hypothetical protein
MLHKVAFDMFLNFCLSRVSNCTYFQPACHSRCSFKCGKFVESLPGRPDVSGHGSLKHGPSWSCSLLRVFLVVTNLSISSEQRSNRKVFPVRTSATASLRCHLRSEGCRHCCASPADCHFGLVKVKPCGHLSILGSPFLSFLAR